MMNYIISLIQELKNDTEIQTYTSDIEFLTIPKDLASDVSIVFNEGEQKNEWYDKIGENGRETFPVLIDIVAIRSKTWQARQLRQLLIKKLNGRRELGETDMWYGTITWMEHLPCSYDHTSERVVWGSQYLFQHAFSQ